MVLFGGRSLRVGLIRGCRWSPRNRPPSGAGAGDGPPSRAWASRRASHPSCGAGRPGDGHGALGVVGGVARHGASSGTRVARRGAASGARVARHGATGGAGVARSGAANGARVARH